MSDFCYICKKECKRHNDANDNRECTFSNKDVYDWANMFDVYLLINRYNEGNIICNSSRFVNRVKMYL